ncbi:hypothetical protein SSTU70S_05299 [Stutzerimonas stutzeri]
MEVLRRLERLANNELALFERRHRGLQPGNAGRCTHVYVFGASIGKQWPPTAIDKLRPGKKRSPRRRTSRPACRRLLSGPTLKPTDKALLSANRREIASNVRA